MHKNKYKINYTLLIILIIFLIISLITIISADEINNTVENAVIKQIIWILIGVVTIKIIANIGNKAIIDKIIYIYIIFNLLLTYLLLFGTEINNAKCWIKLPGIGTIQPSEFVKIAIIILLAKIMSKSKIKTFKNEIRIIFKSLIIFLIPAILTFLEPDTGAVLMYTIILISILFISKIRLRWFIISSFFLISTIISIVIIYKYNINLFIKILGSSFFLRVERLINWTNNEGMQLEHGLAAIGSAGFLGNGYKNNIIYFPEAHTDFIFAVYASNFGFLGSLILIILITIFDLEILKIANQSKKLINKYITIGILGILLYQQIQNIGMTFGLLPITGITLPFISYGGSSLLSYMIMIGIIFNINNENKKYKN